MVAKAFLGVITRCTNVLLVLLLMHVMYEVHRSHVLVPCVGQFDTPAVFAGLTRSFGEVSSM